MGGSGQYLSLSSVSVGALVFWHQKPGAFVRVLFYESIAMELTVDVTGFDG